MRAVLACLCAFLVITDARAEVLVLLCSGKSRGYKTDTKKAFRDTLYINTGANLVEFSLIGQSRLETKRDDMFEFVNSWEENGKWAGFARGKLNRVTANLSIYWYRGIGYNDIAADFTGECTPVKPKF